MPNPFQRFSFIHLFLFLLRLLPPLSSSSPLPTDDECRRAHPDAPNPFLGQCGLFNGTLSPPSGSSAFSRRRVVGGDDVLRGDAVWHAEFFGCGATIVDERHVVTAAHCVQDGHGLLHDKIHAGLVVNSRSPAFSSDCTRQTRSIAQIQTHPCYCGIMGACDGLLELQHDVAVLTLDEPWDLNEFLQPACLAEPARPPSPGTMALLTGFGSVDYNGDSPDLLQGVWKPIVENGVCRSLLGSDFTEDMICAGDVVAGGIDGCQGDSGGPLVTPDASGRVTLVGVVSWGIGCGERDKPGVYASVAAHADWIRLALQTPAPPIGRRRRRRKRITAEGNVATRFDSGACRAHREWQRKIDAERTKPASNRSIEAPTATSIETTTSSDAETTTKAATTTTTATMALVASALMFNLSIPRVCFFLN